MANQIPINQVDPIYRYPVRNKRPAPGATPKRSSISLGGGKSSGSSGAPAGVPASRAVGGMADGVEGPPQVETQEAIKDTAAMPLFAVGNAANGVINLGSLLSARTNEGFDPTKAIGGENVPFKPTTGFFGSLRRTFGDQANEKNLAAQAAQGAKWEADADAAAKMSAEDARWEKRFGAETAARAAESKADRDARAAERAALSEERRIERAQDWVTQDERFEQSQINSINDRKLAEERLGIQKKEAEDNARFRSDTLAAQERARTAAEARAGNPDIKFGPDGTPYIMAGQNITAIRPTKLPIGKTIPGEKGGPQQIWPWRDDAPPAGGAGDQQVDPATGRPLGGSTTNPPKPDAAPTATLRPSYMIEPKASLRLPESLGSSMADQGPEYVQPPIAIEGAPMSPIQAYQERARELMAKPPARSPENALYSLQAPLYERMGAQFGLKPEQVGASRFNKSVADQVSGALPKYLEQFGMLPQELQERIVGEAVDESFKNPKRTRPPFGWEYDSTGLGK